MEGKRLWGVVAGAAGNLLEWYDWYVYSAFTLYFAPAFFPFDDPTAQLLSAAGVFAIGFIARPVGAWGLGLLADRMGRRAGLTVSVGLMCLGSLLIALAPTYTQAGAGAPVLLTFARLLQGLSVGGEYGTSAAYLSEIAPANRRGFVASFQYVTLIAGQLLALCVLLALQAGLRPPALQAWGWRVPFFIGAILAVMVFYLRRSLVETDSFLRASRKHQTEVSGLTLFRRYPREALSVMGMTAGGALAFYAYSTYTQKFLVNTSGFSRETATEISAAALFIYMLLQPVAGAVSDRIGRKPLLIGFGVFGALLTWPILHTLESVGDAFEAFLLILAALTLVSGYTAINAVVKAELFPAHVRAIGVSLPYAVANALFGGSAEYVALWFKEKGLEGGFYLYVTAMIGLSLLVYLRLPETRRMTARGVADI